MKLSFFFVAVFILIFITVAVLLIGFLSSQRLKEESFDCGFDTNITVAHLSDMHFPKIGVSTEKIMESLRKNKPTVIAVTGDAFDGNANKKDLNELIAFYKELITVAPVYAVIGNHEIGSPLLPDYINLCKEVGVGLLNNEYVFHKVFEKNILICGVKDACIPDGKNLPELSVAMEKSDLSVLLAHRPEKAEFYKDFDAVFAGHTHGGQVRIFGKGLYAPDQGISPDYTSGRYKIGNGEMFVSRGLGDGNNSFRIFNSYNINYIVL